MKRPDQNDIILSMADCFTKGRKAVYCSSELTTGIRLYSACWENGVTDRYKLTDLLGKEWLRDHVFVQNEGAANEFAAFVQSRQNFTTISPACLFVPEWGQHDYLSFWDTLIKTRISEVWFNANWQYSNGCTFEYMAAKNANLPVYDAAGKPLDVPQALKVIREAITFLNGKSINTEKLEEHFAGIAK